MKLPPYLGICPHCKARVALSASACAGCGRALAPGEAEKAAAREGLYGHRDSPESADDTGEGGVSSSVLIGD
jgi:hypothetical protein